MSSPNAERKTNDTPSQPSEIAMRLMRELTESHPGRPIKVDIETRHGSDSPDVKIEVGDRYESNHGDPPKALQIFTLVSLSVAALVFAAAYAKKSIPEKV